MSPSLFVAASDEENGCQDRVSRALYKGFQILSLPFSSACCNRREGRELSILGRRAAISPSISPLLYGTQAIVSSTTWIKNRKAGSVYRATWWMLNKPSSVFQPQKEKRANRPSHNIISFIAYRELPPNKTHNSVPFGRSNASLHRVFRHLRSKGDDISATYVNPITYACCGSVEVLLVLTDRRPPLWAWGRLLSSTASAGIVR